MKTFNFWGNIVIFDTNCLIILFQLQIALKTSENAESTQCTCLKSQKALIEGLELVKSAFLACSPAAGGGPYLDGLMKPP